MGVWVRSSGIRLLLLAASGLTVSCSKTVGGSSDGEPCELGSLDCECYGNDTCDDGLQCIDNSCSEEESPPTSGDGDGDGDGNSSGGASGDGDGDDSSGGTDGSGATGGSSTGGSGPGGQSGDCDRVGFPAVEIVAYEWEEELRYIERTSTSGPGAVFHLELFYYLGAPSTPYQFSAWENYQTCATCGLIYDCPNVEDYSPTSCTLYEVDAGVLDVIVNADGSDPGRFEATLTNVHAREVTIDQSQASLTTPVLNGYTWCIESISINLTTF